MKQCVKCHKEINKNAVFCPYCGTKVIITIEKVCPSCGLSYKDKDVKFCSQCGSRLEQNMQQALKQHYAGNKIQSMDDLVRELNTIAGKIDGKAASITQKEFLSFCDINNTERYNTFYKYKRQRGYRIISAPTPRLKFILRCLNEFFQGIYMPAKYVTGFVRNVSVVDNGRFHIGQRYIYTIDLTNFFESIKLDMIESSLVQFPYHFDAAIAKAIAAISSVRNIKNDTFCLSQGSPLSPILSNIVCAELDKRLNGLATFYDAKYSRYADDITFSSQKNLFHKDGEFIRSVIRVVKSNKFKINKNKVHIYGPQCCHIVTGIVTNEKVNMQRDYIRSIRNILYIWERYGIKDAYKKFDRLYQKKNNGKMTPFIGDSLRGQIDYLGNVRGTEDSIYIRFKSKLNDLLSIPFKPFAVKVNVNNIVEESNLDAPIIFKGYRYYTAKSCFGGELILISPKLNEYIESGADDNPIQKLTNNCVYYRIFDKDGVKMLMARRK